MPLFRRDPAPTPVPFRFTVGNAFSVPARGVVCTGTVVAGTVADPDALAGLALVAP
ncbi:MAG TPA: hypothetical protein VGN37_16835 [Actinocatenispora sp.]